jgi:hypothetical protein
VSERVDLLLRPALVFFQHDRRYEVCAGAGYVPLTLHTWKSLLSYSLWR